MPAEGVMPLCQAPFSASAIASKERAAATAAAVSRSWLRSRVLAPDSSKSAHDRHMSGAD